MINTYQIRDVENFIETYVIQPDVIKLSVAPYTTSVITKLLDCYTIPRNIKLT